MNGPSHAKGHPAAPEENAAVVQRFYKGMNAHDPSAARLFT
jgi:hypothetical protein